MLRTFETNEIEYQKLKEICIREQCHIGEKLNELIKEYIKIHGDGNPIHTLDKFSDPNFRIAPAFFRDSKAWISYYQTVQTQKEYKELDRQINLIMDIHNKNLRRFI